MTTDSSPGADDGYLRRLLALLASAAFFQGYDLSVLALLLPDLQETFDVGEAALGLFRIPIELGLVVAFFVARLADRVGRRPLLLWSVLGYTAFTALTVTAWDLWSFAFFQFGARVFLGAEVVVAVTVVVEEFPARRRGRALGVLLAWEAAGTIAVALLVAAGLQGTPLGWRSFFLVGLLPLLGLAFARRRLRETSRFLVARGRASSGLLAPWRSPYRRMLVVVGLVHLFRSVPLFGATAWWAFFAQRERGFSDLEVGVAVLGAFSVGAVAYYLCGRAMDRFGRRPTAVAYLAGSVVSTMVLFQAHDRLLGHVALVGAVALGLGAQPVLSAFSTELFPTAIRGQAAAWVRNVFEVPGYVLGPAAVGLLGDRAHGPIGNIGDSVTLLTLWAIPAIWLVWRRLPETRGAELESLEYGPSAPRPPARMPDGALRPV